MKILGTWPRFSFSYSQGSSCTGCGASCDALCYGAACKTGCSYGGWCRYSAGSSCIDCTNDCKVNCNDGCSGGFILKIFDVHIILLSGGIHERNYVFIKIVLIEPLME